MPVGRLIEEKILPSKIRWEILRIGPKDGFENKAISRGAMYACDCN